MKKIKQNGKEYVLIPVEVYENICNHLRQTGEVLTKIEKGWE